ncbi:MAG: N-formylglutamate amidohydrolase [Ruminiclostridium sp.]|nr:N-formylglutamate amidohydrolase [Ruminiclostridium sp.]
MMEPMLIHLPHSSLQIPSDIRKDILITDVELDLEMFLLTDRYTDKLFDCSNAEIHKNMVNRIVFDPERFRSDSDEEMARVGMGAIYTKTINGRQLRKLSDGRREELMQRFYDPYHSELNRKTGMLLEQFGKCLILDGHSFPQEPLPFELDKSPDRPDICIGTSEFHTSPELCRLIVEYVKKCGPSVKLNSPFAGTMVPMKYYMKDRRVSSVMIEVNRKLYMNEATGEKSLGFDSVKSFIGGLLQEILQFI